MEGFGLKKSSGRILGALLRPTRPSGESRDSRPQKDSVIIHLYICISMSTHTIYIYMYIYIYISQYIRVCQHTYTHHIPALELVCMCTRHMYIYIYTPMYTLPSVSWIMGSPSRCFQLPPFNIHMQYVWLPWRAAVRYTGY